MNSTNSHVRLRNHAIALLARFSNNNGPAAPKENAAATTPTVVASTVFHTTKLSIATKIMTKRLDEAIERVDEPAHIDNSGIAKSRNTAL